MSPLFQQHSNYYSEIEVAKEVPLVYDVVGEPETDFYIDSSSLSSTTVLLQGSAAT